jgi:hypothetical protein
VEVVMMSRIAKTGVLVAERGADWSGWVEPLQAESDDVTVILQRCGESPGAFATRVRARVQELRAEGELVAASLVGAARWDDATLSARALVVRTIVTEMVGAGGGRVYLDAGARAGRGRHAMRALAAVVEDQVARTGVDLVTTTGAVAAPVREVARVRELTRVRQAA